MSYRLPFVDLSTFAVNSTGQIQLNSVLEKMPTDPTKFGEPIHVRLYNDSGSTLEVGSDAGNFEDTIPAGAWPIYSLDSNTSIIYFKVINILPTPPIQKLSVTVYAPGEEVPPTPSLGNSPVGIGGSVTTAGSTLSNEGNPTNSLVVDIGDAALAQIWKIFTDHFSIGVDQSGVLHLVMRGQTSGNPLLLGQTGDITEVAGSMTVDQNAVVTGTSLFTGIATFTLAPELTAKKIEDGVGTVLADWSGAGLSMYSNVSTKGEFNYSQTVGDIDWKMTAISATGVTVSASGVVNHQVVVSGSGSTPNNAYADPYNNTPPGSQTVGFGAFTTTTVNITLGASIQGLFHFWQH